MDEDSASERDEWTRRHTQALRETVESLEIGRASANALSVQAEQLRHTEREVDETQATVDMSKRVLRGMSWSGWLYNKLSTVPHGSPQASAEIVMGFICPECKVTFKSPEQLGVHYDTVHEKIETKSAHLDTRPPLLHTQTTQVAQRAPLEHVEDMHDTFLRAIEPQLVELKEQSLALGSALDAQNHQLDQLNSKIERVHHDMKKVEIQANKLAGKKPPVVFRFQCAFQEVQTKRFLRDGDGDPLLSADVVGTGCTFRAYTVGEHSDVWGFQSATSNYFLGINRYGKLKVRGAALHSYEQFLVESKPQTPLFSLASYFGFGGWVARKGSIESTNLTIIRGSAENKAAAAQFKIVHLDDGMKTS